MFLLWMFITVWLAAALLLPFYMLFKAVFRSKRGTMVPRTHLMRTARGY
jgi:hypothetical protein